ncbi:MAG: hypothetical protein K0Q55_3536 [Verrucomicrobia bacterium]|nr:hypothetical protein [Verrucomicrobiota bacterium]
MSYVLLLQLIAAFGDNLPPVSRQAFFAAGWGAGCLNPQQLPNATGSISSKAI